MHLGDSRDHGRAGRIAVISGTSRLGGKSLGTGVMSETVHRRTSFPDRPGNQAFRGLFGRVLTVAVSQLVEQVRKAPGGLSHSERAASSS